MAFVRSKCDFFKRRPCLLMILAVAVQATVPLLARIDGNNLDDDQSSEFYFFRSTSLRWLGAIDSPGWREAASLCFLVGGCMNCLALIQIFGRYNEYSNKSEHKRWSVSLTVFAVFELLCFFCFFMVGLLTPVRGPSDKWVLVYALPYVGLRLGYASLFFWMNACFPPKWEWKHVIKFHICSICSLILAFLAAASTYTIVGYHVLAASAEEIPVEGSPLLGLMEVVSVVLAVLALLFHPLGPAGRPDMLPSAGDAVDVPPARSGADRNSILHVV